jgi:predicted polyphosphate/ATP-dependent NAD kinase
VPAQHRVLVPEHQQLSILRQVPAERQDSQAEYPARQQIDDLEQHPASQRIISQASVFPNTEKASMVLRILRTVGTLGVERVLLSTDTFGIAAGVHREIKRMSGARSTAHVRWPKVEFLTLERPTGTATDTTAFAETMAGQCAAAVVLLGGDGTMRAAVPGLGDTPCSR